MRVSEGGFGDRHRALGPQTPVELDRPQLAQRLPELLGDETVLIMTTHSIIMLALARRVIAMDGGRVVADGPREKLVSIG